MRSMVSALLMFVITPSFAFAHNVGVDIKIRGDKVEIEGYYDDDTAAEKAKVRVEDDKEKVIATGITDLKGKWQFTLPPPGKYVVYLDAGAGHRAKKSLVVPAAKQSTAVSPSMDETAGEGPTRDEFTRTPWLKVAIGLVAICGLSGGLFLASMLRKTGKANV